MIHSSLNFEGEPLLPPSLISKGETEDFDLSAFAEQYPARGKLVDEMLRIQDDAGLKGVQKWLQGLNNLDRYVAAHIAGENKVLRPRQVPIMQAVLEFLESGGKRGYIEAATGVGKTVLFVELSRALNMKTLVVVPRQKLVTQTRDEFKEFSPNFEVGVMYQHEKVADRQATVITYQYLLQAVKRGEINLADYDLIVLDEAHKALSEGQQEIFSTVPDSALIIGTTATATYSQSKKLSNFLEERIVYIPLRDAINEGLVTPYQTIIVKTGVNISAVDLLKSGTYDPVKLERALNKKARNQLAVDIYNTAFKGRKGVVFCAGVDHAEAAAQAFNEGGIAAGCVHYKQKRDVKNKSYQYFKEGKTQVLCGDEMFKEGFDDIEVSFALRLALSTSLVDTTQGGGRPGRLNSKNPLKFATVVDFVDRDDRSGGLRKPILFFQVLEDAAVPPPSSDRENALPIEEAMQKERDIFASLSLEGVEILSDIEEVREYGRAQLEVAPADWVSEDELCARLKIKPERLRNLRNSKPFHGFIWKKVRADKIDTGGHTNAVDLFDREKERYRCSVSDPTVALFFSPRFEKWLEEYLPEAAAPDMVFVEDLDEKYAWFTKMCSQLSGLMPELLFFSGNAVTNCMRNKDITPQSLRKAGFTTGTRRCVTSQEAGEIDEMIQDQLEKLKARGMREQMPPADWTQLIYFYNDLSKKFKYIPMDDFIHALKEARVDGAAVFDPEKLNGKDAGLFVNESPAHCGLCLSPSAAAAVASEIESKYAPIDSQKFYEVANSLGVINKVLEDIIVHVLGAEIDTYALHYHFRGYGLWDDRYVSLAHIELLKRTVQQLTEVSGTSVELPEIISRFPARYPQLATLGIELINTIFEEEFEERKKWALRDGKTRLVKVAEADGVMQAAAAALEKAQKEIPAGFVPLSHISLSHIHQDTNMLLKKLIARGAEVNTYELRTKSGSITYCDPSVAPLLSALSDEIEATQKRSKEIQEIFGQYPEKLRNAALSRFKEKNGEEAMAAVNEFLQRLCLPPLEGYMSQDEVMRSLSKAIGPEVEVSALYKAVRELASKNEIGFLEPQNVSVATYENLDSERAVSLPFFTTTSGKVSHGQYFTRSCYELLENEMKEAYRPFAKPAGPVSRRSQINVQQGTLISIDVQGLNLPEAGVTKVYKTGRPVGIASELNGSQLEVIAHTDSRFNLLKKQCGEIPKDHVIVHNIDHDPEMFEGQSGYYLVPSAALMDYTS